MGEGACSNKQVIADSIPQVIEPVVLVENIFPQKVIV